MALNVSNINENTLYKFDDNRYVIKLPLTETRNGNYKTDKPRLFTEVYSIDGTGFMVRLASGALVNNPAVYDYSKDFAIRDYDNDELLSFAVTMPLKEANLEELRKLREAITRSYEARTRC